jgi:hypothetical protein
MTGTLVEKLGDVKLKVAASCKSTNTNATLLVQKLQILTLLGGAELKVAASDCLLALLLY